MLLYKVTLEIIIDYDCITFAHLTGYILWGQQFCGIAKQGIAVLKTKTKYETFICSFLGMNTYIRSPGEGIPKSLTLG